MEYKTKCSGTIIVPQKARDHLLAHPNVLEILSEAIGKVTLPENMSFLAGDVEMSRVIGQSGCIKTSRIGFDEKAYFALRVEREKPSRVIVNAECQDTTKVTILAFPSREDARVYILVTAFVGPFAPKEPWDRSIRTDEEFQTCLEFWCSNALVYDSKAMGRIIESSWAEILSGK